MANLVTPADIKGIERPNSFNAYQRAEEEFNMKKQLAAMEMAQAQAAIQKAQQLDADKIGEQAFLKAAQGLPITPQEEAALRYIDAKQPTAVFNPVTGVMEQKPSLLNRAGVSIGQPALPAATPLPQRQTAPMSPTNPQKMTDSEAAGTLSLYGDQPQGAVLPAPQIAPTSQPATISPKSKQLQEELAIKETADRKANFTKAQSALQGFKQQSGVVLKNIDDAINLSRSGFATGYGQIFAGLPNTQARALNNALDTIKANIGFDKLQSMRENSPTGGALGQVSDMENRLLQAVSGALDPMQAEQLTNNLEVIKQLYPQVIAEKERAFNQDYGFTTPLSGQATQPAPIQPVQKLGSRERAESIFNAKKAARSANDAQKQIIRQRLQDAGIDPKEAGL